MGLGVLRVDAILLEAAQNTHDLYLAKLSICSFIAYLQIANELSCCLFLNHSVWKVKDQVNLSSKNNIFVVSCIWVFFKEEFIYEPINWSYVIQVVCLFW